MRALDRKLFRDLRRLWGQALAIALVIASGIATFVMSLSTLDSLTLSQETYYERYRFADVFASLIRAPDSVTDRIADIPGVTQVQTRTVVDVTLEVPDFPEPATGRLISIPEDREPRLNSLFLRRGRWIEPGARGEVLANEAFVNAHGLDIGDNVDVVINERWQRLTIVGIALSPEYVMQIRAGDLLPDEQRFGVFWMGEPELDAAYDMEGAFNDVTLGLQRGASEADVLRRLDMILEPYGGLGAFGRDDQLSHRFLSDEIQGLYAMGFITPIIFLGVAAFLLNVVLARLVSTQREIIAALRAFGYTKFEVAMHYFQLVLMIVFVGAVLGTLLGAWMGQGLTQLYARFYHFPMFEFSLPPGVLLAAMVIGVGAAGAGTIAALRSAVALPPAEAMRPEPPATFRPTVIERVGLQQLFSQTARMVLRQLERRPARALISMLGIALAVAVLVMGRFGMDAVDYLMRFEFETAQRYDMSVTFVEPTGGAVMSEIARLPGVQHVEPFRAVGARLEAGHRSQRVGVMGLPDNPQLFRLLDESQRPVAMPAEGLLLSEKLAELLDVRPGQTVTLYVLEGRRPVREVPVTATITDYAGINAYMNLEALNRLLQEGRVYSGAFATVDSAYEQSLYDTLRQTPRVAGVTMKHAMIESFQRTVQENQRQMQVFIIGFAIVIAFGVVYNLARISLAERTRELATLRVIGFTRGEISAVLLGEQAVLTLGAIPLGLALGYAFAWLTSWAVETELFRIPLVIEPFTYGFATLVVLTASFVSGLIVRRRLDRLDLIGVLKARE
ncbi:ABC transporter permease [Phycisphaerales bacterium AB-hyl4]|uniref:ABC transporter permease n=1 Tax=Natronomicrosphaera hydrolytica TaxID=3242702 RepID=A0ABV4U764_9BACT